MPRRRGVDKSRPPRLTYGEKQPPARSQNSMFDITSGPPSSASFLESLAFGFMGLQFFRNFNSTLENDTSSDSEDEKLFYPHLAQRPLEPHPRIRQLTDEEAEKHAKQAAEEQQQRQSKTARNKRKKLRKKEKKRLETKSWNISVEADGGESQQAVHQIGAQAKESPPEAEQEIVVTSSDNGSDEEGTTDIAADDEIQQEEKEINLDISGEIASGEILAKSTETPDAPKMEDKHESDKEQKCTDHMAEEYIHKSTRFAEFGICWADDGRHDMAIRCFTEAIKLNPKEPKLFGNRSFCYEKMQQYDKALSDAEVSLLMEPKWVKGLFRKAKALRGLKRYNEASLVYKEVLKLDGSCCEAMQELNQMQMLQLMEMGFTQEESAEALQSHNTLEAAIDALFNCMSHPVPGEATEEGKWIVHQASKPKTQHAKELGNKLKMQPLPQKPINLGVFQVWVGCLAQTVTYSMLYEVFSRVGTVYKVKMLLDQQSALVSYARQEDCVKALQCIHGMTLEGSALVVRLPFKHDTEPGMSRVKLSDPASHWRPLKRECFFWRTTGCQRQDCSFRHVPEHKHIDKDKVTGEFGTSHMET